MHVQATTLFKKISIGIFKKEAIFLLLLGHGYMRNNLPRLGGIQLTKMFLISIIFILCFDQGDDSVFWSKMGWTKININTSASLARWLCECLCTNLDQQSNLFFSNGYEPVSSLARWNRLINQKTYYSAYWARSPIGIFFFKQATHFQCCHNHLKSICF